MKFGVREICDVVLKAKAAQKIGDKVFYKNEPVCYFDSLKTSSLEGAATTVYAQGGRGNARLIAWEGERTVTFTMEDALISPIGFSILTGAGLIRADSDNSIIVHTTEQTNKVKIHKASNAANAATDYVTITLDKQPYIGKNVTEAIAAGEDQEAVAAQADPSEDFIYVMLLDDNGEIGSEPFIASEVDIEPVLVTGSNDEPSKYVYKIKIYAEDAAKSDDETRYNDLSGFKDDCVVLVDYYVEKTSGTFQVDISPDKFGGNFYLEASTLFRDTNGVDMPAEFIIPNCKVQSNFTFTMASSGDPSTFTFTMDAFPDYTRWNKTKKVFAAIQVLDTSTTGREFDRLGTAHDTSGTSYDTKHKPFIEID